MATLVQVLSRFSTGTNIEIETIKVVAICSVSPSGRGVL